MDVIQDDFILVSLHQVNVKSVLLHGLRYHVF